MATDPEATLKRPPLKPEPDAFEPPVSWLFGRQFIANLKWILLYTAFKGKLDARDWMNAEVVPEPDSSAAEIDRFWRAWNENWQDAEDGEADSTKEFWFDYISDTGDGQKAMYSVAYLCLSDLAVSKNPQLDEEPKFLHLLAQLDADKMVLPRGTFLFVGGDTSYHISDYGTLANRFQNPFWWAIDDLTGKARSVMHATSRLLLGIPGNHDYYDSLDGFNRQFRRPATGEDAVEGNRTPQLMIPTFKRRQEASFLALRLPFDWWFWGLDMEGGEIDFRQLEFFRGLQERYAPTKLIVATPAPTTVFGKFATEEESQSKSFAALELERPFLKNSEPLGAGKCRVDLAGDVHHYARYWGPRPASGEASNYTSVVSGGGGAFFHPTQTTVREVPPQVVYPVPGRSRADVADQIVKLRNIWQGGWVWLFGGLIAVALYFAASFPQSSKTALDTYPLWVKLGISPQTGEGLSATYWEVLRDLLTGNARWKYSLLLSIVVLGAALGYSAKLFGKEYDPTGAQPKKSVRRLKRFTIWMLILVAFLCLAYGLWGFYSFGGELSFYSRSMIILVTLVWSVLAVIESVWYSEWLFAESYRTNIKAWHYWPIWILLFLAVIGFGAALWYFGTYAAGFLISDLVNLIVLVGVLVGLIFFAYSTGAHLKHGSGKLAFALLGASHALLQLTVAFLMVRKGHLLWATLGVAVTAFVFKYIGRSLAKLENGWPLAIAWVALSAALLSIPFILNASLEPNIFKTGSLNMPDNAWHKLLLCLWAGAVGAVMSCVVFGWYLAVSLAFNGHNNEAGGAARIEGFKELIRFRINREGLTGYVIGFDKPQTDGSKLDLKIIDVFHIRADGDVAR
jgi:hypothetical protein